MLSKCRQKWVKRKGARARCQGRLASMWQIIHFSDSDRVRSDFRREISHYNFFQQNN